MVRHPHVGVQVEALQMGVTGSPRRHGLDVRLPPESSHPSPGAGAQRHPSLMALGIGQFVINALLGLAFFSWLG